MDITAKLSTIFVDMILPLLVGYALRWAPWNSTVFFNRMITVGIVFLFPFLTLFSIWGLVPVFDLVWLPVFGFLLHVLPGGICLLRGRRKYCDSLDYGSYAISGFLSNRVTLGALTAYVLYGETGYAYAQMVVLFDNLLTFGFAYPLAQYYRNLHELSGKLQFDLKRILFNRNQLPLFGMVIGALLNWQGIHRPESFLPAFGLAVHFAAWTFLLPVGYSMDFGEVRNYLQDAAEISLVKCILTPVLTVAAASFLIHESVALKTLVLLSAAPTAVNAVIVMKLFGLNLHLAVAAFVLSTAVYLLAVFPLFFFW